MYDIDSVHLASTSAEMRSALDTVERAASSRAALLLTGESGTGKGVLARLLHQQSSRSGAPFVEVSCPTLSEQLLSAELFGHARGAFTGAVRDRPGRVELAHGGTLFLDEVGELSPAVQAQLLRFLHDRSFERLGESRTRHADVRLVAATHRDLEADVRSGRFRLDLYYRLGVIGVRVPPLRDRPGDVLPLARHLLARLAQAAARRPPELSPAACAALVAHCWPGNVRELHNELERALALSSADVIDVSDLSEHVWPRDTGASRSPHLGGDFTLAEIEREHIERVLARGLTFDAAARVLGIDDSTLWRKRRRFTLRSA